VFIFILNSCPEYKILISKKERGIQSKKLPG